MVDPSEVRFEVVLPAPLDEAWNAFLDHDVIRGWFGWQYDGLDEEIAMIFTPDAVVADLPSTLRFGGHQLELSPHLDGTLVRASRCEPVTNPDDPIDWDEFADDLEEGWYSFLQQLRFRFSRADNEPRRTLYLGGEAVDLPAEPLWTALGLGPLDVVEGSPLHEVVGPGDGLVGSWFYLGAHQAGAVVESWGPGLLVAAHAPNADPPWSAASLTLTTYGMDESDVVDLEHRWSTWWADRYAPGGTDAG